MMMMLMLMMMMMMMMQNLDTDLHTASGSPGQVPPNSQAMERHDIIILDTKHPFPLAEI